MKPELYGKLLQDIKLNQDFDMSEINDFIDQIPI